MSVSQELQRSLDLPAPRHTVQVVLFASGDRYRAFLANRIPEARHRKAIFYSHRDVFQIYAYRNPQLLTDLRHEFTHAVLHQALPYLPLWIDEGLAEYFEDDPVSRSRSSRVAGVKWKSRMGWTPNLQQLEQLPAADQMDANDYRDSWAWISYLMNSSEASRELLKSYLLAISAGGVPGSFTDFATTRDPSILKGVGSYFRRFQISVR